MSIPGSSPNNEALLSKLDQLVNLADDGLKTMDAGTIRQLRSGTQQFIVKRYGQNSHFYKDYARIDSYNSQYTVKEVRGLLLAIRDDVKDDNTQSILAHGAAKAASDNLELTRLILSLFHKHGIYNWDAVNNLILYDSDYFEYTVEVAEAVYKELIDRRIIAPTGMGKAYCITEEGKKLFERMTGDKNRPAESNLSPELLPTPTNPQFSLPININYTGMFEIFLSYSWDSEEFQGKVLSFADFLRTNGFHAIMDVMLSEEHSAIDFEKMMHISMHQSKKVIIILSKGYKEKAEGFKGGVGKEYSMLIKDIEKSPKKYILVSFDGIDDSIIPYALLQREIVDCTKPGWEQKLFSKLSDENRYVFSDVAPSKPVIEKIRPAPFKNDTDINKVLTKNSMEQNSKETGRDGFTKATIEILAKRVGYICSNPNCKKATIGANEIGNKATIIGIAAHISAASPGGPRFDASLTSEGRRHIDNGIWLCSNCATLIDKDINVFTVSVLKKWKENAEEESRMKLSGQLLNKPDGSPFLEIDLIWTSGGRSNRGYSNKNPVEMQEGKPVMIIQHPPIIHWALLWNFNFVIYNNSNYPAYNINIESVGDVHFAHLDKLPKINNLPPLKNLDLKARYEDSVEGDYLVAENLHKKKIPEKFKNLILKLTYYDDARNLHTNYIEFTDTDVINKKP